MTRALSWTMAAVLTAGIVSPRQAAAGAWTREPGHVYLNVSYSHIAASNFYTPDFHVTPIQPYEQHVVGFFGEVGIAPWLSATLDGTIYRRNQILASGYTEGVGDWRLGVWTALSRARVRLALGLLVGIPLGDPAPSAGPNADADAQQIARSLPTGDGEWDVEARLAAGTSLGGVRAWPVRHYVIAEAGYWQRTHGFAASFTYKLEVGTQFPYRFVDRFWLIWRFSGVESFASEMEAARDATGLGNGVTYLSPGVAIFGRIWKGLGASVGVDSALRARSVAAAVQLYTSVSWQY
jgi:hypothetical protein